MRGGTPKGPQKRQKHGVSAQVVVFHTLAGPPGKSNVVMSRSLGKSVAGVKYNRMEIEESLDGWVFVVPTIYGY